MKFVIKVVFLLLSIALNLAFNLKNIKNLDPKNTYYADLNTEKPIISSKIANKTNDFLLFPNKFSNKVDFSEFFKEIGDKTFFCIVLLYLNSGGNFLFLVAFFLKIIYENTKNLILFENFIPENHLFKIVFPLKIFQFLGVLFYQLYGYSILFKMIFQTNLNSKNGNMRREEESIPSQEKLMIFFIIIFSFFSYGVEESTAKIPYCFNFYDFSIKVLISLITISVAFLIGEFIYRRLSRESIQFFTSISFLLISIDSAIKLFSS